MILRDRGRLKRRAGRAVRSLDRDSVGHGRNREPILLREVISETDQRRRHGASKPTDEEQSDTAADTATVLLQLPPRLREVAQLLLEGAKGAAIARALGISRRQVRSAVAKIREHFRRAGLGES